MNNCPHCNTENCVPQIAITNCVLFNKEDFKILCRTCGKPILITLIRTVNVISIQKGNHTKDDFGYNPDFKLPENKNNTW